MINGKLTQDKNLEEKLRKLVGNTKKPEDKKDSKPVEVKKIPVEKEETLSEKKFQTEKAQIPTPSSVSLGEGIKINGNAPQVQQGLERNIANIPSPQPIANEQIKREEAYQHAKILYESGENRRIEAGREAMRTQRNIQSNVTTPRANQNNRRVDLMNLNPNQARDDRIGAYEINPNEQNKKLPWDRESDDLIKYA